MSDTKFIFKKIDGKCVVTIVTRMGKSWRNIYEGDMSSKDISQMLKLLNQFQKKHKKEVD